MSVVQFTVEESSRFKRLKSRIQKYGYRKSMSTLFLFVLSIGIVVTIYATLQEQDIRQQAQEVSSGLPLTTSTPATQKYVFITGQSFTGNLGGLSGADSKCQELANAASGVFENKIWKAWLSDSKESVVTRFSRFQGPYILRDGTRIADSFIDLTDGSLLAPIIITEAGTALSQGSVWTNTTIVGSSAVSAPLYSCDNFTTTSGTSDTGMISSVDNKWTQATTSLCNLRLHLYCFEQ